MNYPRNYLCAFILKFRRLAYGSQELFGRNESLLAGAHVLKSEFALGNFLFASQRHKSHMLGVGICHLLLHLHTIRIYLGADASLTATAQQRQAVGSLGSTKVDEEQTGTLSSLLGIEV